MNLYSLKRLRLISKLDSINIDQWIRDYRFNLIRNRIILRHLVSCICGLIGFSIGLAIGLILLVLSNSMNIELGLYSMLIGFVLSETGLIIGIVIGFKRYE